MQLIKLEQLPDVIRMYRCSKRMSQPQLGKLLGTNKLSISKWERGECKLSVNYYIKLLELIFSDEPVHPKIMDVIEGRLVCENVKNKSVSDNTNEVHGEIHGNC